MKRYYFLYFDNNPKRIDYLIDLIEQKHNIDYFETRDFKSSIGFSLFVNLTFKTLKQVVFNGELKDGYCCKDCRFPLDLSLKFSKNKNMSMLGCINCGNPILEEKQGTWIIIKGNVLFKK